MLQSQRVFLFVGERFSLREQVPYGQLFLEHPALWEDCFMPGKFLIHSWVSTRMPKILKKMQFFSNYSQKMHKIHSQLRKVPEKLQKGLEKHLNHTNKILYYLLVSTHRYAHFSQTSLMLDTWISLRGNVFFPSAKNRLLHYRRGMTNEFHWKTLAPPGAKDFKAPRQFRCITSTKSSESQQKKCPRRRGFVTKKMTMCRLDALCKVVFVERLRVCSIAWKLLSTLARFPRNFNQ